MSEKKAIRVAYGEALAALGEENEKVVVLDADLAHATMTATFANKFPQRFFNAGIAEANMIDMAAGLSTMGFIPFASTFAVFAGRCFDQIRNGVCYPGFNVKFGMTHAGITLGEDGGSHQAIEDVALMRSIPGMTIIVPCDAKETWRAVKAAAEIQGPVYLRLARLPSPIFEEEMPFEVGKANTLREGTDVAVFTCGIMVDECLQAAEQLAAKGISAAVINMHTIKPLDEEAVLRFASSCGAIVTVEEHSVIGGLGDAVGDVLLRNRCAIPFEKIGVQDRFGQSGKPDDVLAEYGLDVASIAARVEKFVASK
ncbi:MAG: transketolase family protein [Candidatus Limivicinus sp.]